MKSDSKKKETAASVKGVEDDDGRPTAEERKEDDEDSEEVQHAVGPQAKDCCASGTCEIFWLPQACQADWNFFFVDKINSHSMGESLEPGSNTD